MLILNTNIHYMCTYIFNSITVTNNCVTVVFIQINSMKCLFLCTLYTHMRSHMSCIRSLDDSVPVHFNTVVIQDFRAIGIEKQKVYFYRSEKYFFWILEINTVNKNRLNKKNRLALILCKRHNWLRHRFHLKNVFSNPHNRSSGFRNIEELKICVT